MNKFASLVTSLLLIAACPAFGQQTCSGFNNGQFNSGYTNNFSDPGEHLLGSHTASDVYAGTCNFTQGNFWNGVYQCNSTVALVGKVFMGESGVLHNTGLSNPVHRINGQGSTGYGGPSWGSSATAGTIGGVASCDSTDPNCYYPTFTFTGTYGNVFWTLGRGHVEWLERNTQSTSCPALTAQSGSPIVYSPSGQYKKMFGKLADGIKFEYYPGGVFQTAWIDPDSDGLLLVYDKDGDGKIDWNEVFGNYTGPQYQDEYKGNSKGEYEPNGFAALSVYDRPEFNGNSDGKITAADAVFSKLRFCRCLTSDSTGKYLTGTMYTLADLHIKSISLKFEEDRQTDKNGNALRFKGKMTLDNDTEVPIIDVFPVTSN